MTKGIKGDIILKLSRSDVGASGKPKRLARKKNEKKFKKRLDKAEQM